MNRKVIRHAFLLLSFAGVAFILIWASSHNKKKASNEQKYRRDIDARLKTASQLQLDTKSDFKCTSAKLKPVNLSFPMCVYTNSEDLYISGTVLSGGYFEAELVTKFVELFRQHEDVTFLDLGANLGTYSLPISHLGRHVVAVEPNPETFRRLSKSIHLGGIADTITALNCAVADDSFTSIIGFDSVNRGDTFLVGNTSGACGPKCTTTLTTTLDSLLPFMKNRKVIMKVDTQESEVKIFTRKAAGKFFETVDVPLIMMEWDLYRKRYGQVEEKRRTADRFLEFFYQRGYEVYDPRTEKKLPTDWTRWSYDILFKKEDLRSDKLFSIGE